MPYKRRYGGSRFSRAKRRRFVRRPKKFMRRAVRKGAIRSAKANLYMYKQKVSIAGPAGLSSGIDNFGAMTFQLSDLPQATTFVDLYDQFSIRKVVLKFFPRSSLNSGFVASGGYVAPAGRILTVNDHDDASVPTSISNMRQHSKCKETMAYRPFTRVVIPSVLAANYQSAIATAYTPKYKTWIDTTNSATPHYGFKWGVTTYDMSYIPVWDCVATYYVAFKNVK